MVLSKNPLDINVKKKLDKEELIQAIRLAIIGELDAINLYLQIANACKNEIVKRVLEDIAREEKTHVGELLTLLRRLDKEQEVELKEGEEEVRDYLERSL